MSRKDYKIIAKAINLTVKDSLTNNHSFDISELIGRLSLELKEDNANFQPEKFRQACLQ